MNAIRPTGLIGLLLFVLNVSPLAAQSVKPAAVLSPEAMERFLLTAKMVSSREAGDGITNSQLATFTDGTITHDVHIQTIDEFKMVVNTPRMSEVNFRDTYRYNIAAYRLLTRRFGWSSHSQALAAPALLQRLLGAVSFGVWLTVLVLGRLVGYF